MKDHVLVAFPDFRKLFVARLISCVGDKFYTIAIAWWVLSAFPDDGKIKLSWIMAFNVLPVVLFGPFMGTLTDRLNKKHCMIISDIIRAALLFILAYLIYSDQATISMVLAITFAQALTAPLFDTATQSSISILTDKEHTAAAVSMNSSVTQVAAVVGALVGSMLIFWTGIAGAILFNAIAYLISLIFVFAIRTSLHSIVKREPFLEQFKSGFKYLSQNPPIYSLLIGFAILNLFFAPIMLLLPIIVKDVMQAEANILALFEAALASGAVLMTIYLSFKRYSSKIYVKLFLATLIMGMAMFSIGYTISIIPIMVLLFAVGLALSYVNASSMALFQLKVPQEMKGRFFAVLFTVAFAVIPFSYMMVGWMLQFISVSEMLFGCGAAIVALSTVLLLIPRVNHE